LGEEYSLNTRAAGVSKEYALIHADAYMISWADYIICMEEGHKVAIEKIIEEYGILSPPEISVAGIPDRFSYMDSELVSLIKKTIVIGDISRR